MERLATPAAATAAPNQTEIAGSIRQPSREPEQRRGCTPAARIQRILDLREAIARGEYRVCAADLADALMRAARRRS